VLYYLGANRSEVRFTSQDGGRLLLIGGPPFPEKILMFGRPQRDTGLRRDSQIRHMGLAVR
jgi:hypothetical protein